jgi:hypothetical protein
MLDQKPALGSPAKLWGRGRDMEDGRRVRAVWMIAGPCEAYGAGCRVYVGEGGE